MFALNLTRSRVQNRLFANLLFIQDNSKATKGPNGLWKSFPGQASAKAWNKTQYSRVQFIDLVGTQGGCRQLMPKFIETLATARALTNLAQSSNQSSQ